MGAARRTLKQLHFEPGQAPPLWDVGYWSLTMSDEHSWLVANPIDRYATRPERPGFVVDDDGGITITLAASLPAGVPEANWLPAPEGRFRLGLRAYYPALAITDGRWAPPAVTVRAPEGVVSADDDGARSGAPTCPRRPGTMKAVEDFVVARNPDGDSTLPYLLRLPLTEAGIVLKARDTWPRTAKVYCHPSPDWPDDPDIVERVPARSCVGHHQPLRDLAAGAHTEVDRSRLRGRPHRWMASESRVTAQDRLPGREPANS